MTKNAPELRFKGFTDDWELRKLSEGTYIKSRIGWQRLTKDEYLFAGDYYLITGTDIDELTHSIDLSRSVYVSKERYEKDEKIQVKEGDIIITKDGTIGKVAMVQGLDKPATLNSHLFVLRDISGELDNRFLLHVLDSPLFTKFVEATKTGSTLTGLPQKTFVNFMYYLPSKEEQQRISELLDRLDAILALHQRKLDLLKQLKQAYLQKMFPKNEEKVPEIRFSHFDTGWELCRLGELAEIIRGASPRPIQDPKWFDLSSDIGWLRISDVTEQDGRIHKLEQKLSTAGQQKTRVLKSPHLLLSIAATVGKPVINYIKTGVHDGFLIFLNPLFNTEFMFQWLEMFKPQWQKYGQPGSQVNLNSELVRNQEITLPSFAEQDQIANFFEQIDKTIDLHQNKLDQLNSQKSAFLKKMFI